MKSNKDAAKKKQQVCYERPKLDYLGTQAKEAGSKY